MFVQNFWMCLLVHWWNEACMRNTIISRASNLSRFPSKGGSQSLFGGGQSSPFGSTVVSSGGGGLFSSPAASASGAMPSGGSGFGAPPAFGSSPVFGASAGGFGSGMQAGAFGDSRGAPSAGFGAWVERLAFEYSKSAAYFCEHFQLGNMLRVSHWNIYSACTLDICKLKVLHGLLVT